MTNKSTVIPTNGQMKHAHTWYTSATAFAMFPATEAAEGRFKYMWASEATNIAKTYGNVRQMSTIPLIKVGSKTINIYDHGRLSKIEF